MSTVPSGQPTPSAPAGGSSIAIGSRTYPANSVQQEAWKNQGLIQPRPMPRSFQPQFPAGPGRIAANVPSTATPAAARLASNNAIQLPRGDMTLNPGESVSGRVGEVQRGQLTALKPKPGIAAPAQGDSRSQQENFIRAKGFGNFVDRNRLQVTSPPTNQLAAPSPANTAPAPLARADGGLKGITPTGTGPLNLGTKPIAGAPTPVATKPAPLQVPAITPASNRMSAASPAPAPVVAPKPAPRAPSAKMANTQLLLGAALLHR